MVKNLKKLRLMHGVSQKKLGDAIGVSQQSINKYENHTVQPDIDTLIAIANFFDVSIDFLVGYNEKCENLGNDDEIIFTKKEYELLKKYHKLNPYEKRIINIILNECSLKK